MNLKLLILLLCGALFGFASVPACAQSFTTLYNFNTNSYGADPQAALTVDGNVLYGSCRDGGDGSGVLFAWKTSSNSIEVLHSFSAYTGVIGNLYNTDGVLPEAQLVLTNGTLYGTASTGGTNGFGTIFSLSTNGSWFTNLYTFTGGNDGGGPNAALALSGDTLYGATYGGGAGGQGTLFSIKTNGVNFTVLHSFPAYHGADFTNQDGSNPGPMLPVGNRLYGTTGVGGTNGYGTLFSIQKDGLDFKVLHMFSKSEGFSRAPLTLSGQTLYGASYGGINTNGSIYSVNLDGSGFTNFYSFLDNTYYSENGLLLAGTSLYGIGGKMFAIHTNGTGFVTLHSFSVASNTQTNSDGVDIGAGLTLVENTLYGVAGLGGTNGWGTLFSLTLPPVPDLAIGQTGTNVILSWPTNAMTYTLQTATNLVPPTAWLPVESLPLAADGQNIVTNTADATARFYRLSQ